MRKLVMILGIFILVLQNNSLACTIFNYSNDSTVLVGNNEDYLYSTEPEYWVVNSTLRKNGYIVFGWEIEGFGKVAQGGMNEKGLFIDWAACPSTSAPVHKDKPEIGIEKMVENILAECNNLDEAVNYASNHNFPFNKLGIHSHVMFVDSSGTSAVVEWVEGEIEVIPKYGSFQVITNFWLTHPEKGRYPCKRYSLANRELSDIDTIYISHIKNILRSTVQKNEISGTIYSNIYDLKSRTIYIYNRGNFDELHWLNLPDELKKNNYSRKMEEIFFPE